MDDKEDYRIVKRKDIAGREVTEIQTKRPDGTYKWIGIREPYDERKDK